MPLYQYECEGGHKFELFKHRIEDRYNAQCPECNKPVTLIMSPVRYRLAEPLPIFAHDGTKVYEYPDSPKIRPPTPPEELVRIGELSNAGDRFQPQKKGA